MHCTKHQPQGTPSGGLVSPPISDRVFLLPTNYYVSTITLHTKTPLHVSYGMVYQSFIVF